jgi:hypothetical protein
MTRAEEKHWVAEMQRKLRRVEGQPALPVKASDEACWLGVPSWL